MPHLVSPPVGPLSIAACLDQLRSAHAALVGCGATALRDAVSIDVREHWGTRVKRSLVRLGDERPLLLQHAGPTHSLAETVNQCATIERLMDALAWAGSAPDFAGWHVSACHPTTSSSPGAEANNDLVLEGPAGERALFEVSDVAGSKDGNRKEENDLVRLGCMSPPAKVAPSSTEITGLHAPTGGTLGGSGRAPLAA